MHFSKKSISIILAIVVVIIVFAIIIVVLIMSNSSSDESFVPGDYDRYYISNNGEKKSANRILAELMHNTKTLQNQISSGSFPNFATMYGVFNNYIDAMKDHKRERMDKVEELVADVMSYLGYKASYLKDAASDEWRILERKLINMNGTFDTIRANARLLGSKMADELEAPLSEDGMIRSHFESSLGRDARDEYNLADSVMDSLNNMNNTSQIDYANLLASDTTLTSKSYQDHVNAMQSKRNKKYFNDRGEKILPNIQTKIITESVDGTVRHDPIGYRGDPRVYSNNLEAAKEIAYNPDVIQSIYQPSMRLVQVS